MESAQEMRRFLRNDRWAEIPVMGTDQDRGVPAPPLELPVPDGAVMVDLIPPDDLHVGQVPLIEALRRRRSRRTWTDQPLSLEELSFLLWATQGIRLIGRKGAFALRMVPSAGARHPFETYLWVSRVEGLAQGLYRYLAIKHKLCLLRADPTLADLVSEAAAGQTFVGDAAVTFLWAAVPYRTEWRYDVGSAKVIALDAGHLCQNLYLACEGISAGTCAIGAYDQSKMDALLGLDGHDQFIIYAAPVGKVS